MRNVTLAVAAVAAFLLAGMGAIWYATRLPDRPAASGAAPVPVPGPVTGPDSSRAVLPSQRFEPPPPPLITDPPPPPPPAGSWEAVTPVGRLSALGPLGGAISRELSERGDELARCFDVDVRTRASLTPPSQAGDAAGEDGGLTPTVMLEIETSTGSARIVDATVDSRAGAGDGLFSCAQQVLRGLTVPFPAAKAGRRYRVPYALTP